MHCAKNRKRGYFIVFAQIFGSTTFGLNGVLINVEVDISNGIPSLDIVGLPDTAVRESRERVRAAIRNSGFEFPARRITVNLAPGGFKKRQLRSGSANRHRNSRCQRPGAAPRLSGHGFCRRIIA